MFEKIKKLKPKYHYYSKDPDSGRMVEQQPYNKGYAKQQYKQAKIGIREQQRKMEIKQLENRLKAQQKQLAHKQKIIKQKQKIKGMRRDIRERQLKPLKDAYKKTQKGLKQLERVGGNKKSRSQPRTKSKGKTVLMVDSSGRIIGTKTIKSKTRTAPKQKSSSGVSQEYSNWLFGSSGSSSSGVDTNYFIGSSGSTKKKKKSKNQFDNLGGWI